MKPSKQHLKVYLSTYQNNKNPSKMSKKKSINSSKFYLSLLIFFSTSLKCESLPVWIHPRVWMNLSEIHPEKSLQNLVTLMCHTFTSFKICHSTQTDPSSFDIFLKRPESSFLLSRNELLRARLKKKNINPCLLAHCALNLPQSDPLQRYCLLAYQEAPAHQIKGCEGNLSPHLIKKLYMQPLGLSIWLKEIEKPSFPRLLIIEPTHKNNRLKFMLRDQKRIEISFKNLKQNFNSPQLLE
jgi:hypothetical protein